MDVWTETVVQLCDVHAPEKEVRLKSETKEIPWYTDEIVSLQKEKNTLLAHYRCTRNINLKKALKSVSNKLKNLKRKRKKEFFAMKIDEQQDNPRRLWSLLREASCTEQVVDEVFPDVTNSDTADEFNHYFATIGKKIQDELNVNISFSAQNSKEHGFSFKQETPEGISKLIDNIKAKVATGHDRIPAKILKDLNKVISPDICSLINLSYQTKTFPSSLKQAVIKPIFKNKGNSNLPEFYRPISILPIISKIFEKSATNQLVQYMENS